MKRKDVYLFVGLGAGDSVRAGSYSSFSNKSKILRIVSSTTEVTILMTSISLGGVISGVGDTVPVAVGIAVGTAVGRDVGVGFGVEPEDIVSIGHISS